MFKESLAVCSEVQVPVVANDYPTFLIYALSMSIFYLNNGVLALDFEIGSCYTAQAGLELTIPLSPSLLSAETRIHQHACHVKIKYLKNA